MVKVGVQTKGILPEMGIEDGVAIIARAGFEMVDFNLDTFLKNSDVYGGKINKFFDADIEDILAYFGEYKKMFDKYGIKPSQMHAPYPMYVLGRDDISQYMQNVVIPKSIQIAGFLEIPWVVMHPFKMQYKYGLEAEQAMNVQFFSSLIPELKKHNVRICVENLYESVGGRITEGTCANPDDAIFYVDMLNMMAGEERFGICLDTGHIQLVHRQPADYIRKVGSRPSCGTDWESFAVALAEIGYDGTLSFETFPCVNSFPYGTKEEVLRTIHEVGEYIKGRVESAR